MFRPVVVGPYIGHRHRFLIAAGKLKQDFHAGVGVRAANEICQGLRQALRQAGRAGIDALAAAAKDAAFSADRVAHEIGEINA